MRHGGRTVIRRGCSCRGARSRGGAHHAAPPAARRGPPLRAVADNPVSRWPSAFALAAVGAGWKAARWLL
jgi:hypothetical protein